MKRKLLYIALIFTILCITCIIVCNRTIKKHTTSKIYTEASIIPTNKVGLLLGTSPKLKNGNNEVGEVLYVQLQNILHRISMNPFIGQTTEVENIRYIIPHPGYTLFYRHSLKKIEVVVLWDNRLKMGELKVISKKE